ncbi:MAG: ATP-binding cassette domain-containing protein, partial [Defluviitaleaceae bacterium]|nr:ATP-binding cassette domain-containing protein [Defluviitaleaceae bacterium]
MIRVTNLHKKFNDLHVLKGINEEIKQGEKVFIIGPSGSGKSTFLRCLNLLERPTSGDIFINGTEITSKNANIDVVRSDMGMVFQQFNLFPHLNVMKNITLAPIKIKKLSKKEAEEKALILLEKVGLLEKADA